MEFFSTSLDAQRWVSIPFLVCPFAIPLLYFLSTTLTFLTIAICNTIHITLSVVGKAHPVEPPHADLPFGRRVGYDLCYKQVCFKMRVKDLQHLCQRQCQHGCPALGSTVQLCDVP